jgi:hypothetical protein
MILGSLTILIMLAVSYAFWREGLLTACTMFINVVLAGLIAFNFFEPIAAALDPLFADLFLHGFEDALALMFLFCFSLGILRLLTNTIAISDLEFPPIVLRVGCVLFGVATGYLASGFIACVLQTLPYHEHFLGFEYRLDPNSPGHAIRSVLPPDRVWLALMQRAGAYAFAHSVDDPNAESPYDHYFTFDKYGSFEYRYARHRRYNDEREALPDQGDFAQQGQRRKS